MIKKFLDVNKREIKRIAEDLDSNGSELVLKILKHIDSDELTYTSRLARELRYTWANTKVAVDKLLRWGFIKKYQYVEKVRGGSKRFDNVKGIMLTKRGYLAKIYISSRHEYFEIEDGKIKRVKYL